MAFAGLAIPPLPAARARALPLMLGQDVAIAELAAVVESDPALVAALLRAANSAPPPPAIGWTRRAGRWCGWAWSRRARSPWACC